MILDWYNVPAAIGELEKIEMIRMLDGNYILDHAITATQKAILAAFGLDAGYVKRKAAKYKHLITKPIIPRPAFYNKAGFFI